MTRSPLNGGVCIVVPNRFLLLPAPAGDLPPGPGFEDGPGGRRRFGPGFYAELLRDLGALALIGLDGARSALTPRPSK